MVIRVPFVVSWPAVLPQGEIYSNPVSALDIFPTSVQAAGAGADVKNPQQLDGVDLIPFLTGEKQGRPHDTLYWRRGGGNRAIRDGDWKLLRYKAGAPMLFNLAEDPAERTDLAEAQPERVKLLQAKYKVWSGRMMRPRW